MDLEYRLDGPSDAPLLVLSNSLGTTYGMWEAQMPAFTQHFRVLRYNARGHGRSPLPPGGVSLASLGNDVIALLDRLGVEQAHFCGISLGGMTGLWLNRHAPERFHRLVVANTAAKIGEPEGWRQRAALVRQQGIAPVAATAADRWFTPAFRQRHPEAVQPLIDALGETSPEGYAACCDALAHADLRDDVQAMPRPMLVIAGDEDPVTTLRDAERLVEDAPQARCLALPASHLSNVACAGAFSQHVTRFLTAGAQHEYHR
ncbi:3-oxoadipate enol-lactonase [Enterobacter wuhouensis]|uniref:3-oxoadipate enol-lactonase n=1 Tax=Enterobacter wuhouensis TaxID=2529381 RepID=UPI0021E5D004|nr:3-oxoadipate enol-lactonase [Enterobacter wuhouensis]MCV2534938.1 3-oxoadipate enol-lactonase [Enterobacter wuhouensis]